ncbi:antiterminator Q family protein [Cronobacter turicensis]
MYDIYEVMNRWGAWAASEHNGVDWQPIAAGFKGLLPYSKKARICCNDDEGIMIDGCVARLRKYKPHEHELIVAHFILGISLRKIARKRKHSDGTIRKELQMALGFIEGMLCVLKNHYSHTEL